MRPVSIECFRCGGSARWKPLSHWLTEPQIAALLQSPQLLSCPSGRRPVASGLLARGPRLGRTGSDLVPADVGARHLVRDPFDLSLGEHFLEELKFRGAGLTVLGGHCPDRAAVQVHPKAAARKFVEVGQVPLAVEDLGQDRTCTLARSSISARR